MTESPLEYQKWVTRAMKVVTASALSPNVSDAKRDLLAAIDSMRGTHTITVVINDGQIVEWTPIKP